jgi:hypothetical protein
VYCVFIYEIKRIFCKQAISPRNAAEWEFCVESRKGKMLCTIVKYWNRILLMEQDELLICCYETQEGNWKSANGARNLSDELHR